MKSWIGSPCPA
ncbi:uncharacterized protein ACO6RY_04994 [Pungitius sinensis]